MNKKSVFILLVIILIINLFLNIYGIKWGLPYRWNVDEKIATALRMGAEKTLDTGDLYHAPFYKYILMISLAPYILFLKMTGYPFSVLQSSAAISWIRLAEIAPEFATNVYVMGRLLSVFIGVAIVYFIYLIGKRFFSVGVGLFSAAILAGTMGFITDNHFARSSPLVNLLAVVTIYFCLASFKTKNFRCLLYLAHFFGGLAFATKYNGVLLICPLIVTQILHNFVKDQKTFGNKAIFYLKKIVPLNKVFSKSILFYILGFLFGWPIFLGSLKHITVSSNFYRNFFYDTNLAISLLVGMLNYLIQLITIFNVPIMIFILWGLFYYLFRFIKYKSIPKEVTILLSLIVPYFLITSSYQLKYAYTKFIILIVPFLCLFAGKAIYDLFLSIKKYTIFKYLLIFGVFIYSFAYSFSASMIYAKNDTRFQATEWILNNIPFGSTIEHFQQVGWLFSARIIPHYNIIFLGRSSKDFADKSLYKIKGDEILEEANLKIKNYCKKLDEVGPTSDYFIFSAENPQDALNPTGKSGCGELKRSLIGGKFNYKLIKQFNHSNWKVNSKRIKGLSYPKSFWRNPIPNSYTSPVILIFKRINYEKQK